ncbi:MAG: O-antigen ligase family protein [Actinomycetes bacterium]
MTAATRILVGRRTGRIGSGARAVLPLTGAALLATAAVITGAWPLVLLLAVLVPVGLVVARRPQLGVLGVAALLPLHGLHYILPFPEFAQGWKEAAVLGLFLATFVCPAEARAPKGRRLPGWAPAVAGLMVLALVTVPLVSRSSAVVGLRISFFNVLLAIVVWRCPLDATERDRLITIFITMAFVTSLFGLYQQRVGHEVLNSWGYPYNEVIRFTNGFRLRSFSTFNQPFPFAFYLMLTVLLAVPQVIADPQRLRNRLFLLSTPVLALALVFTYVRGAFLGLAIGLLYLAFHRYKVLVALIPLALVAFLLLPQGSNFTSAATQSNSLNVRTTSWVDRAGDLITHPIGTGIGTIGAAAEKAQSLDATDPNAPATFQSDNSYLKVGFELGIIGLWLFVALLVSAFLTGRHVERRVEGLDREFAASWCASVLAIMGAALVATYFEMVPMDALFWLGLGTVSAMAPRRRDAPIVAPSTSAAVGTAGP